MQVEIKPFDETTAEDAKLVVRRMFGSCAEPQVSHILQNPLRRLCQSAGDVVYEDNRPVGFQAAILRRVHIGNRKILAVVGGMLAMYPEASPVNLLALMKKTIAPRAGSSMFIANTANPSSMKMNRMLGIKGKGPYTCGVSRFGIVHFGSFLRLLTRGMLPVLISEIINRIGCVWWQKKDFLQKHEIKVLNHFDAEIFQRFWDAYLKSMNGEGVVLSRTVEELNWAFLTDIQHGRNILLGRFSGNELLGYIVVRRIDEMGMRWQIVDWISIANDEMVLWELLCGAKSFLYDNSKAAILQCIGFPERAQKIICRVLPFKKKHANNSFIYSSGDHLVTKELEKSSSGWFWGPYDGDRCIA